MKTVRIILPVMAILFAVAGALASINSPNKSLAIQEISIRGGACEPDGFCDNTTVKTTCTYNNDENTQVDRYTLDASEPVCDLVVVSGEWEE